MTNAEDRIAQLEEENKKQHDIINELSESLDEWTFKATKAERKFREYRDRCTEDFFIELVKDMDDTGLHFALGTTLYYDLKNICALWIESYTNEC